MNNFLLIIDQWSPVNPEGQKRYEPDFLRFLSRNNPKCQKKPESLPDLEIIVTDSNRVCIFSIHQLERNNLQFCNEL